MGLFGLLHSPYLHFSHFRFQRGATEEEVEAIVRITGQGAEHHHSHRRGQTQA